MMMMIMMIMMIIAGNWWFPYQICFNTVMDNDGISPGCP